MGRWSGGGAPPTDLTALRDVADAWWARLPREAMGAAGGRGVASVGLIQPLVIGLVGNEPLNPLAWFTLYLFYSLSGFTH